MFAFCLERLFVLSPFIGKRNHRCNGNLLWLARTLFVPFCARAAHYLGHKPIRTTHTRVQANRNMQ